MATTKAYLSDILSYSECSNEPDRAPPKTLPYSDSPSSAIASGSPPELASTLATTGPSSQSPASPTILSPKTSPASLSLAGARVPTPLSPKRRRPDSRDGDDSPVSSPKRRRVVSARLPTPTVSRRSSLNFASTSATSTSLSTIPRSFADIEAALAPLTHAASPMALARAPVAFDKLPRELNDMIFSLLDYKSLISLSQVNTSLNRIVDPQVAPAADKFAFVMAAENYFPRHWPKFTDDEEHPGNFACYSCFRVRGPEHFEETELDLDEDNEEEIDSPSEDGSEHTEIRDRRLDADPTSQSPDLAPTKESASTPSPSTAHESGTDTLRRYCIDCGTHQGLHRSGLHLTTKANQKLWICSCRRICQTASEASCPECHQACPAPPKGTLSRQ
ncbi:hypothetical protein BROUX41_006043 [Berkeleyomyces rouxiae]